MVDPLPAVSAVVLAYGPEPLLTECVQAVLASTGVRADVVLVDNGCTTGAVAELDGTPGVTVLRPQDNLGFTGGCNLGARRATGEYVAFVNGDALVRPEALAELVAALDEPEVAIASASLRLLDRPEVMNSAGNPLHFLGLSWAGGLGEPATAHDVPVDITSATGAAVVLRRATFEELGAFWEPLFAYLEDTELSLRAWERGLRVRYVPTAVVLHRYEFSRNPLKTYLLERNRLLLLLTHFERRTLLTILPGLLALELAVLALAARQGWLASKVRAWWWVARHLRLVRLRRREVQARRTRSDADLLPTLLTPVFAAGAETGLSVPRWVNRGMAAYWRVALRVIGAR